MPGPVAISALHWGQNWASRLIVDPQVKHVVSSGCLIAALHECYSSWAPVSSDTQKHP